MAEQQLTAAPLVPPAGDPRPALVAIFAALCVVVFYVSAVAYFFGGHILGPVEDIGGVLAGLASGQWGAAFNFVAWLILLFPVAIAWRTASWMRNEGRQPFAGNVFNDATLRNFFFEMLLLAAIGLAFWFVVGNAVTNLERQGIASGFDFLGRNAGFQINQSPFIAYSESSTYATVFWVGLLNTLMVAVSGVFLATVLGFVIGIARLSPNWILSRVAYVYVEVLRNIPLLLWIFIWYFAVLRLLPDKAEPLDLGPFGLLNIAGYYAPKAIFSEGAGAVGIAFLAGIVASIVIHYWARARQMATGKKFPVLWVSLALIIAVPIVVFLAMGMPVSFEMPTSSRFGPRGGSRLYPEFIGLLVALVMYTASYIAEIVRAGILAVNKGQTEAAAALGLRAGAILRLVVVPQALRVIIPPLTNQYLNLTKNSSLAVAIAYPDLVSVFAGTALNQTGQAVEILLMTMLTYLVLSLGISFLMNIYNARMALVER